MRAARHPSAFAVVTVAAASILLPVLPRPARAEGVEAACRFAEAVGQRLGMPDLGLGYLDVYLDAPARKGKVPAEARAACDLSVMNLLQMQLRQEQDEAKRSALMKRAAVIAKPALDKLDAPAPKGKTRPALAPDDFWLLLGACRMEQAAAKGAADEGTRLLALHERMKRLYAALEETFFTGFEDPTDDPKPQIMLMYRMRDGEMVLSLRLATGLSSPQRIAAFSDGVEAFREARGIYDDSDSYPWASLGMAQCRRALAKERPGDPKAKEDLDEARKLLTLVLGGPACPAVTAREADEARAHAARELVDIALEGGQFQDARNAVASLRKSGRASVAVLSDRADLLGARVDWEDAARQKAGPQAAPLSLKERAVAAVTRLKDGGGPLAQEAEDLLGSWEGGVGSRRGRNWMAEADEAFRDKRFDEAARKYRAVTLTARPGERFWAQAWFYLGACHSLSRRYHEASVAFDRAARGARWDRAGESAFQAWANLRQAASGLPEAAQRRRLKEAYQLHAGFPGEAHAPEALVALGRILREEGDLESACVFLARVPEGHASHPGALYEAALCRHRIARQAERTGKDPAEAAKTALAAEEALGRFSAALQALPAATRDPWKAQASYAAWLRIEVGVRQKPDTALALIETYAASYPDAKAPKDELASLKALALGAKRDFAAARKAWDEAAAAADAEGRKPWPLLGHARALQRLCEGSDPAARDLSAALATQIGRYQPFKFKEAAERFQQNVEDKRWAEAREAAEQILENVPGTPLEEANRPWMDWFLKNLPDVYISTEAWAKAAPLLAELQDNAVILGRYGAHPGEMPPPIASRDWALWEKCARVCARAAEGLPPGEERVKLAARAAESWGRLILSDFVSRSDGNRYWEVIHETVRAEALAGQGAAARDRLHSEFVTYPELGGKREGFVKLVRDLQRIEPSFAADAAKLLEELVPALENAAP